MSNNRRDMGHCTLDCVRYSYVYHIASAASHPVIFGFQHWLIYLDVICLYHGRRERWNVEKINHQITDIDDGPQCIQHGDIFMSCSSYAKHTFFDNSKCLCYSYSLQEIFWDILKMENNGYSIFIDNCKIFKQNLWNYFNEVLL